MSRAAWLLAALGGAAALICSAQPAVAPSEPLTERKEAGPYTVENSWELGYRFRTVGGNIGKYRSDVNFGNGVRLLASRLAIHSRDGKARYFDELAATTQGLGNDPYQSATLRLRKNGWYEYNLLWRWNAYFNPALTIADGLHRMDTTRRWQDHDLTLWPDSKFRALLGYSRNHQEGPALSTVNFFGASGDEFPVFQDVRRERNEYRAGGEVELRWFRFRLIRAWENFKDDTPGAGFGPQPGSNPDDEFRLDAFRRDEPYHGNSPSWRGSLFLERGRWLAVSAAGTYTGSERAFLVDESAAGVNPAGPFDLQTLVFGSGRRPLATGNGTVSVFPSRKLSIANHTAYYNVRTEGDSLFRQFSNRTFQFEQFEFQSLGIRTVVNATDVNYSALRWLGVYGGYHYSTRRIRSREFLSAEGFEELVEAEQDNTVHSGLFGLRLQPPGGVTVNLETEIGRAGRPFVPVGEKNYHLLGGRVQYRRGTLLVSGATRIHYNTNSTSLSSYASRSRNYALDFSWVPSERLAVDAGYGKMHLDSLSGIAYFAGRRLVTGERSLYVSNVHAVNAGAHVALHPRCRLYLGYSRVEDTGDGRRSPLEPPAGSPPTTASPLFLAAQAFPATFESPSARLTVQLRRNLLWNAGYQYYGYREKFAASQGYRAHTGYLSVVWSF